MADYVVKSGDTFSTIAKNNNISLQSLCSANPKVDKNHIKVGQKISIPNSQTKLLKENSIFSLQQKTPSAKTTAPAIAKTISPAPVKTVKQKTYTIKKGDSFEKIAKDNFLSVDDLKKANSSVSPTKIKPNQVINLPEKKAVIKPVNKNDVNFKNNLAKILKLEGGFKKAEKDGSDVKTNKGITQETYNRYLKDKAFDKSQNSYTPKDVKNITEKEVKEIYYNYYYLKSGADKISDKKASLWTLDTAVNCGTEKAKELFGKCKTDNSSWYANRNAYYKSIVQNQPLKKKFYNGWLNRTSEIFKST